MQLTPSHVDVLSQIDAAYLSDNCDVRSKEHVKRHFSPEDVTEMKNQYFALSAKVTKREELMAQFKDIAHNDMSPKETVENLLDQMGESDSYGEPLKLLKASAAALLKKVTNGYEMEEEQLYGFAYHEAGLMAYYDRHGLFVYDRRLVHGENQTSIISMKKTA